MGAVLVPVTPLSRTRREASVGTRDRFFQDLHHKTATSPPPIPPPWAENELHTTTTVCSTPPHRIVPTDHRNLSADVGAYTYGLGHPMKPQRMRMTHELVAAYDMLDQMQVLVRCPASDSKHQRH